MPDYIQELMDTYCRRICAKLRKKINGVIIVLPQESGILVKIKWNDFNPKLQVQVEQNFNS